MKASLVICVLLLSFTSCDVPGRLEIVNKTDQTAYYKYLLLNDSGGVDTFNIEIQGMSRAGILYGFGWQWNDERITDYSERIEKIELLSVNDTIVMNSQPALEEFFTTNREGLLKKSVRVVIK
jgi:hypothetical protein